MVSTHGCGHSVRLPVKCNLLHFWVQGTTALAQPLKVKAWSRDLFWPIECGPKSWASCLSRSPWFLDLPVGSLPCTINRGKIPLFGAATLSHCMVGSCPGGLPSPTADFVQAGNKIEGTAIWGLFVTTA